MCDKVNLENNEMLEFIFDCYRDKNMPNKAVNAYPSAIQFVLDQFKTQEIFDTAADTCQFVFDFIPDRYITQELCDKVKILSC